MKTLGKILLGLIVLVALGLAAIHGYKFFEDYQFEKQQQEKADERIEALSRINYTIPAEFKLPVQGDRGYGYIDYNYEENGMLAQIKLDAWREDRYVWGFDHRVDTIVDSANNSNGVTFSRVLSGPEEVDLNGIDATSIVVESYNDDGGAFLGTATFSARDYYYLFKKDGYIYEITYSITNEDFEPNGQSDIIGDGRDDAETNKCVTLLKQFEGSISSKS